MFIRKKLGQEDRPLIPKNNNEVISVGNKPKITKEEIKENIKRVYGIDAEDISYDFLEKFLKYANGHTAHRLKTMKSDANYMEAYKRWKNGEKYATIARDFTDYDGNHIEIERVRERVNQIDVILNGFRDVRTQEDNDTTNVTKEEKRVRKNNKDNTKEDKRDEYEL